MVQFESRPHAIRGLWLSVCRYSCVMCRLSRRIYPTALARGIVFTAFICARMALSVGARRGAPGRPRNMGRGCTANSACREVKRVCRIRSLLQAGQNCNGWCARCFHGRNPGVRRCVGCAGHRRFPICRRSKPRLRYGLPAPRSLSSARISRGTLGCTPRGTYATTTCFAHQSTRWERLAVFALFCLLAALAGGTLSMFAS